MRLLNKQQIWESYSMPQALNDIAQAFQAASADQVHLPLRTRINLDPDRTLLFMPAAAKNIAQGDTVVKTIALYPQNAAQNLPTAPALIQLVDSKTGLPKAILEGDTVTRIRTGASSGVAFKYLANPDGQVGVVVGTGSQAYTQVLAMLAALPKLVELRIVNPQLALAEAFVEELKAWAPFQASGFGGKIKLFQDSAQAVPEADAIILVTSASQPVIAAKDLTPGVTISCVGSYQPHMQECGSDVMARADLIVCDQIAACLEESGDLIKPLEQGLISTADLQTELGQIVGGEKPGRTAREQIIVYETVGVGAQDLWAAQAIVAAASQAGIGQEWDPYQ